MKLNCLCLFLLLTTAVLGAPVESIDVRVQNMTVTLGKLGDVQIEPLPVQTAKVDVTVAAGKPGWRGPTHLPKVAWIYRGMKPGSLKITTADAERKPLLEGNDYLLDPEWATLGLPEGGKVAPGTKVACEYQYTLSRIDLIETTPDGKLVVIKGKEDMKAPRVPAGTAGNTPIASVYLAHNTDKLSPENINLIDPAYAGVPTVTNADRLQPARDQIAAGKPTVIAFFGDSITAMGTKDLGEKGNFVDRFTKWLGEKNPMLKVTQTAADQIIKPGDKEVVVVKAGVGGDDTPRGLKRLAAVLAHKPNVIVIMFGVNDENGSAGKNSVPVETYKKNLATMVDTAKAHGALPVLMTTSMKNLKWVATVGNLSEYAAAAREVAKANDIPLIDNFAAWEQLPKRGYNYMVYLDSCINHPGDLGHELFLSGVVAAFGGEAK